MTRPQVDLSRWQPHLDAAKREGKSVAAYAADNGLSRHTLYAAAKALRQGDITRDASGFARVRVAAGEPQQSMPQQPQPCAPALRLRAQLPNGVALHLEGHADAAQLAALLGALGALACSA